MLRILFSKKFGTGTYINIIYYSYFLIIEDINNTDKTIS